MRMFKITQFTADNLFYTLFLGWLFAIQWIWPNTSGRNVMVIYFGGTVSLKVLHLLWYLSCSNDTENCCGQIVKWLGVIGTLQKFVDIRQVMLGNQKNNETHHEFNGLAVNLVFHFFHLGYVFFTLLYFYMKKRRQEQKYLPHVSLNVGSTSYM